MVQDQSSSALIQLTWLVCDRDVALAQIGTWKLASESALVSPLSSRYAACGYRHLALPHPAAGPQECTPVNTWRLMIFSAAPPQAGNDEDQPVWSIMSTAKWLLPLIVLSAILNPAVSGAPVGQAGAVSAAKQFFSQRYSTAQKAAVKNQLPTPVEVLTDAAGRPAGYALDLPGGGFIILSADDHMPPVKLHSATGQIKDIPPELFEVIREELAQDLAEVESPLSLAALDEKYAGQWEQLQATGGEFNAAASQAQLSTAVWNQNYPYNKYAPTVSSGGSGGHAYAGCVATQMGILMRYHHAPDKVLKDGSYTDSLGTCKGTHAIHDVSMANYDWGNMPEAGITSQSPAAQQDEIARLLYHCGVSVSMNFEAGGSGAGTIVNAITNYFGYRHQGLYYKQNYSITDWYEMIAADIDSGKPIPYYFTSSLGGHAVVCDGYRNSNEIHLNFGWSGYEDAWFNMDRVTAQNVSWTGHYAIFGLTPPNPNAPQLFPKKSQVITGLGKSATLAVDAYGTPTPSLQWRKQGVAISGATDSTLTLNNIQAGDFVNYDVVATNSNGSCTSSVITLVIVPLTAASQPSSLTVVPGITANLVFSVTPTNEVTYQWYGPQGALANATNGSLAVSAITTNNTGNYYAVAENPSCTLTSQVAHLTVNNAFLFTTPPAGTNVPVGKTLTLSAEAAGLNNIAYSWYRSGKSLGKTGPTLTIAAVKTTDAGNYACVASAMSIATTSAVAVVKVGTAPVISTQPAAAPKVLIGSTLSLGVVPAGSSPFAYQWYYQGSAITGATNSSYKQAAMQTNQAGAFQVIVQNVYGAATSRVANVYVSYPPAISNIVTKVLADEGSNTNLSVLVAGRQPFSYAWYRGSTLVGNEATLALTNLGLIDKGTYKVVVTNIDGKATSGNITLTLNENPRWVSFPKAGRAVENGRLTLTGKTTGVLPMAYFWYSKTNLVGITTNASITLTNVQTNYEGGFHITASNRLGQATCESFQVYVVDAPTMTQNPTNSVGDECDSISFTVAAAGREPLTYLWYKSGLKGVLAQGTTLTLTNLVPTNAGSYYVVVTNIDGKVTSKSAALAINAKPRFRTQPVNKTVAKGGTLTLTASATGVAPMTYLWYFGTNTFLGTNAGTLTLKTINTNYEGNFFVIATNRLGTATSTNAFVYIKHPPVITTAPKSGLGDEGSNFTFSVVAAGREPLSYAWRKTGSTEPIGFESSLVLTNLATNSAGSYTVTITNVDGKVASAAVVLGINAKPRILSAPGNTNTINTSNLTLVVKASGAAPMTYIWSANGLVFAVTNNGTIRLSKVQTNQAGEYSVTVSNWIGKATASFNLTVADPPVFTLNPVSGKVREGDTLTLTANATGKSPMAYQWKRGAESISGATNSTLTVTNAGASDGAVYCVTASNADGTRDSSKATVTMLLKPVFTSQPVSATATNGERVTLRGTVTGTGITYQWQFNSANISGATASSYAFTMAATKVGAYKLLAKNAWGTITSEVAQVTYPNSSPGKDVVEKVGLVIGTPATWLRWPGAEVSFAPPVTGASETAQYQWYHNETLMAGATNAHLVLTQISAADAGLYRLAVQDGGLTVSEPGELILATHLTADHVAQALPGQILAIGQTHGGSPILLFTADAARGYDVEFCPDMQAPWTPVAHGEAGAEVLQYLEETPTNQGFYRIKLN